MASTTGLTDDNSAAISYADDATTAIDMDTDGGKNVGSPPPADSSPFQEGEKVLAHFSDWLYEAKVLKKEFGKTEWRFYVHYLGWNKNWDEWVGTDRVKKYTKKNIQLQQALKLQYGGEKMARVSQAKPKSSTVARGKKRKNVEKKRNASSENMVSIQIPPILKKQLVDDCDFVTRLGKFVKLPRTPNVDAILKKYLQHRSKKDGMIADSVGEILSGLRCYFDKALPAMLLYKSERKQYQEEVEENVAPSLVYGAEHLLRLFVKLPEILSYANIEEQAANDLQEKLQDFLKFLQKKQSSFFLSTYEKPAEPDSST